MQQKISHREFRVWMWYFDTRFDRPALTDHHLMQIGSLVASFVCKEAVSMQDMRLKFTDEGEIDELTEEELMSKAREISETRRQMLIGQLEKEKHHGG